MGGVKNMRRTLQDQVKPHLELLPIDASPCGTGGGGVLKMKSPSFFSSGRIPFQRAEERGINIWSYS